MYVMAVSTISDNDKFWGSLKKAYGQLPRGARWTLAVGSTDGTRAVNVIVHDSIDSVKSFFEKHTSPFGTTEYFFGRPTPLTRSASRRSSCRHQPKAAPDKPLLAG
jgi:hypothetical protein